MAPLYSFFNRLKELSSGEKILLVLVADLILLTMSVAIAYILRTSELELPPSDKFTSYFLAPIFSVVAAYFFGVYEVAARNYSANIESKIVLSQVGAAAIWVVLLVFLGTTGFARSVVLIYIIISIVGMILLRRLASAVFNLGSLSERVREQVAVLIYGAGREGMMIAESLRRDGRYKPVGFLDTDYTLVDRFVSGLKVFPTESISSVVKKLAPQEAIIAKPDMTRASRRLLVDLFSEHGIAVKTVPGLADIIDGNVKIGDIRPILVEDLLGRDPVPPDISLMQKVVKNQVVMITGAGGSIGSELVRQVAQYEPRTIVLVENNEYALFEIHREMEAKSLNLGLAKLVPVLADVQSKKSMDAVMKANAVDIVFHAAAYKHVRLVQENPIAGLINNVLGTLSVAQAAMENGVSRFILVSTDKAVRPTSIMGASKRIAEMVVQALAAEKSHETIFSMVRFGNVLASTGSVVPLFREQITKGGPLTVTHPDVTRYFMLIPEAAQLVIQAGAMAESGQVFVLDMGEPIKILTLAETMIELAGLTVRNAENPDGDIEISFVGLKDGEKLFEELEIGNDLAPTQNKRIMTAREFFLPMREISSDIEGLADLEGSEVLEKVLSRMLTLAHMRSV